MKTKYFDIHVSYEGGLGFSVFLEAKPNTLTEDFINNDVVSHAVSTGQLEPDDIEYVDNVTEISQAEYEKASNA